MKEAMFFSSLRILTVEERWKSGFFDLMTFLPLFPPPSIAPTASSVKVA